MFTIRDSPSDYANVVCWGSEAYIPSLSDSFRINDVVEIKNPSIQTKGAGDDRWRPTTSRWAGRGEVHAGRKQESSTLLCLHMYSVCVHECNIAGITAGCTGGWFDCLLHSILSMVVAHSLSQPLSLCSFMTPIVSPPPIAKLSAVPSSWF